MIQEELGPKNMFLKPVRLDELGSLPSIKGGIQLKPFSRNNDELVDMQLIIDASRYNGKAGEIGLKLPLWTNVEFMTAPTRLVIDIPDSDEEDLCHRNGDHPARLALCRLDPKLLDKTSPYVDGIVSSDGRALTVRAVFNKDAKPSNCDPEIEMMGLGNWNVVNPSPDLDIDVFQSSANYNIKLGKLRLDENELPRDTILLQKASLEDQIALRPIEVPNVDLAFNFGNDIGPEDRWRFSAKCQKSGIQTAVPLEDFVHKPRTPRKVGTAPPHIFGIQRIMDSLYQTADRMEDQFETSSSICQEADEHDDKIMKETKKSETSVNKEAEKKTSKSSNISNDTQSVSKVSSYNLGPFRIHSKGSIGTEEM